MPSIGRRARAQCHLRQTFVFLGMHPVNQPEGMIANAARRFDEQRNPAGAGTEQPVRRTGKAANQGRLGCPVFLEPQ
jgi:NAD(P)H-dependent FMN reductase